MLSLREPHHPPWRTVHTNYFLYFPSRRNGHSNALRVMCFALCASYVIISTSFKKFYLPMPDKKITINITLNTGIIRNIFLTGFLLVCITLSMISILRAATPNPGHSWTEVGDGLFVVSGPTGVHTYSFPDATTTILTTNSAVTVLQGGTGLTSLVQGDLVYASAANTFSALAKNASSTRYLANTGASNNPQWDFVNLVNGATGTLSVVNGGTGTSTLTANNVIIGNGASPVNFVAPGGNGEVLTASGSTWISNMQMRDLSSFRTASSGINQYYTSPMTGTALGTAALTVNVLRALPFIAPKNITIDTFAVNVTTASSGAVRLGIYNDDGNLYPSSLVVDAGTINSGSTGVKTISNTQSLVGGKLYWLVTVTNTTPTLRGFAVGSLVPILGCVSTLGTAAASFGWSVAFTYNSLPASFPGGGAAITATPLPAVFVRLSSN